MDEHHELNDEMDDVLSAACERMMRIEPQLRRFARAGGPVAPPSPSTVHIQVPR